MGEGNMLVSSIMEMTHSSSATAALLPPSTSSRKTERKVIEKIRRNQMKTLFSDLYSLLPKQSSQEVLPLTDQIDEAINYIKTQEAKLKKFKEKKESLTSRKRSFSNCTSSFESTLTSRAPKLEIREMGSSLQIILISGLDNQFLFCEIIRVLQDEGVEIATANFSVHGNSIFHTVLAQMRECDFSFGAAKVTERLNRFINGSTSELESEPDLWNFNDLDPETWEF